MGNGATNIGIEYVRNFRYNGRYFANAKVSIKV